MTIMERCDAMRRLCVSSDAGEILSQVSMAIRALKLALGEADLINQDHRKYREAMKVGFLNTLLTDAVDATRPKVDKLLEGLVGTAIKTIHKLEQVAGMGKNGAHWADDFKEDFRKDHFAIWPGDVAQGPPATSFEAG